MAEAVAVIRLVSAIVQLVDYGTKIIKRLNEFQSDIDQVPQTFRDIKNQLPLLLNTLQRTKAQAAEHPDTLTSMANLASTYRNQGRWKEAEELEVQVMETSLRVLGAEHPDTLTSIANLASTYKNQETHQPHGPVSDQYPPSNPSNAYYRPPPPGGRIAHAFHSTVIATGIC
jgi:hypothetical protein